jgi:hypothetical protein
MATRPKDEAKDEGTDGAQSNGAPEAEQKAAVDEDLHRYIAPVVGPDDEREITDSGIEIKRLYEEDDVKPGLQERLGEPGEYPLPAASTRACTATGSGRCASTPASRAPRTPTSAIAI